MLKLFGWRIEGHLPELPRFVLIVAPHTSNWDSIYCLFAMFALDLRATWLGKHTMFWFPAKYFLQWLGGEAINRETGGGAVEFAVKRFLNAPRWVFGLAPEGTRRFVAEWKTGFYRIGLGASVPIVPVAVDYAARCVRIHPAMELSGNRAEDLAQLQGYFQADMARDPARFAPPRFPEDGEARSP